jgi:CDP-diacylglycerol--serine O-phosphatidyltransferase
LPIRYLVPNALTAASMLCGLGSIFLALESRFVEAAWFSLVCVLLDKLDGFAARLLRAQSRFGVEFDSFADFVGFGVAPAAVLVGFFTEHPEYGFASGPPRLALLGAIALFVMALAGRLARYNVSPSDPRYFFGLPSTLCGGLMMSFLLTCLKYGAAADTFTDPRLLGGLRIGPSALQLTPVLLVVLAALMLSRLRLPKLARRGRMALNVFQGINVAAVYLFGVIHWLPEYLFAVGVSYAILGLVVGTMHHEDPAEAGAATH